MDVAADRAPALPRETAVESPYRRTLEAAVSYFMVILTVTWILGPIREFFVRGGSDPLMATLAQTVATLLALTFAAGWVVRTFSVPPQVRWRLGVGLGAVALFVVCDTLSALLLFNVSILDLTMASLDVQGFVIALMLLAGAILPALRFRSSEA